MRARGSLNDIIDSMVDYKELINTKMVIDHSVASN